MAIEAVIGSPFTFQALFLDASNTPVVVVNPRITVFQFSGTGVKQLLVDNQPLLDVTPAETGRYTYVYIIPSTFDDGDTIYGEMTGTNGADLLLVKETVMAIAATRSGAGYVGLNFRFV